MPWTDELELAAQRAVGGPEVHTGGPQLTAALGDEGGHWGQDDAL